MIVVVYAWVGSDYPCRCSDFPHHLFESESENGTMNVAVYEGWYM